MYTSNPAAALVLRCSALCFESAAVPFLFTVTVAVRATAAQMGGVVVSAGRILPRAQCTTAGTATAQRQPDTHGDADQDTDECQLQLLCMWTGGRSWDVAAGWSATTTAEHGQSCAATGTTVGLASWNLIRCAVTLCTLSLLFHLRHSQWTLQNLRADLSVSACPSAESSNARTCTENFDSSMQSMLQHTSRLVILDTRQRALAQKTWPLLSAGRNRSRSRESAPSESNASALDRRSAIVVLMRILAEQTDGWRADMTARCCVFGLCCSRHQHVAVRRAF